MAKWKLADGELKHLDRLALIVIVYLVVVCGVGLLTGFYAFAAENRMLGVSLFGLAGSAVAALTSCLDRYARGFEREDGTSYPTSAESKEKFNRRMARWFFARPFLGLFVAPVLAWGIELFVDDPDRFRSSIERVGFTAFMAGLLAKSVLDLIKGLFKNVFRA